MLKTITAALAADTTLLTITDAAINDSSIIEVYTDDDDLFPKSISQTGNTLSIIFDEQITVHAVKILVNNLNGEFTPFSGDYNDLINKPSIPSIDVIPLLEEGEHIADIDLNGETYSLYAPTGSSAEVSAEDVSYDSSVSGMLAENVQSAIDELNEQKQPLLSAGDNITIEDNVISAASGGLITYPDNGEVVTIGKLGNRFIKRKGYSGNSLAASPSFDNLGAGCEYINAFGYCYTNDNEVVFMRNTFPTANYMFEVVGGSNGKIDVRAGTLIAGRSYRFFVDYIEAEV